MVTRPAHPVRSHDLQSVDVIKRLKDKDHILIEEIASRFYLNILQVIESEIPTIADWHKRDEKLKWFLLTQVELLGCVYKCEERIEEVVVAEEENKEGILRDLVYDFWFLSQDLLLFLSLDLGYSTWNLLDFLDPNRYFELRDMSQSSFGEFARIINKIPVEPSTSLCKFCEILLKGGIEERSIETVKVSLADFLHWVQKYKLLSRIFYEAKDGAEALYAFQYMTSTAAYLLSLSMTIRLLLKPFSK